MKTAFASNELPQIKKPTESSCCVLVGLLCWNAPNMCEVCREKRLVKRKIGNKTKSAEKLNEASRTPGRGLQ